MGRVFWQFFLAILLTIICAIGVIVVTNSFLKVLPPKGEMLDFRERLALETVSDLVRKGAVGSARDYIASLATLPHPTLLSLNMSEKPLDEPACRQRTERYALAFDQKGQGCYRVDVIDPPPTFIETYLPPLLPPLAALFTSSISAFLLARYLVRPVMTVRVGLSALASGNFGVRISPLSGWRKDEITALGHDFDATAGKLEELQASQRRLFHDVSHELRSPLSRMQAAFGLLKQNPAKLPALMTRMEHEIDRLDGLVEEILTLARLGSSQALMIESQSLDVIDLLSAVVDDAAFEAQPRDVGIAVSGIKRFVSRVNGELIYRAIENVVRNAVKYSNRGSTILVTTRLAAEEALVIDIANEGVFVAERDVERIFEPFTRLLENETAVGHGLGLAITRRAIESHGGSVSARANPDGGLTVTLILPQRN